MTKDASKSDKWDLSMQSEPPIRGIPLRTERDPPLDGSLSVAAGAGGAGTPAASAPPREQQKQTPPLRLVSITLELSDREIERIATIAGSCTHRAQQDRTLMKDFQARGEPDKVAALEADAEISEGVAAALRKISQLPPARS